MRGRNRAHPAREESRHPAHEIIGPAHPTLALRPSTARVLAAFFLEYDDERSGSFEPLDDAPEDRQIVLGLVSTKTPELETPQELLARVDDAAPFFPRDQLGLSTQCGFASIASGNPITEADDERKLRLVADTAHAAWG
jgi:5-methyltetrahydropteroyltriglutamate--homocysteine methyltransferase